jgi:Glycosyl transferase 4-like domain
MKKVLIVTRIFPPMAAVGVYRVIKLCKFLPEFGWQPVILTVDESESLTSDRSLLDALDPKLKIYRCSNPDPIGRWEKRGQQATAPTKPAPAKTAKPSADSESGFGPIGWKQKTLLSIGTPDTDVFWTPNAVRTGLRAIREQQIDAVITTSPPPSVHLVGTALSYLTGTPHLVDFRDLWTQGPRYHLIQRHAPWRLYDRWLEKRVLGRAAGIAGATEAFVRQLQAKNPGLDPRRMSAILNGLDPDDFRDVQFPEQKTETFTILHLGSLYGLRDPSFFFEVLQKFISDDPSRAEHVTSRFIGNVGQHAGRVRGTNIESVVDFCGHKPHQTVLSELWGSDLLLLILGFSTTESGTIPAKLFEYIATNRPLLAFTPEGEASAMIRTYAQGHVFTGPDMDAACRALTEAYKAWRARDSAPESSLHIPDEFHRRHQSGQMADLLNLCLGK